LPTLRMTIGHTSNSTKAPPCPNINGALDSTSRFYKDFQSYLMALVGLAQMLEAAGTGSAKPFDRNQAIQLGCATDSASWYWCPETTAFAAARNFANLPLRIERISHASRQTVGPLALGALGHLLEGFGQVLATNYFERNRPHIEQKFGTDPNSSWPSAWNFARVVRNAMAHGGAITFLSQTSPPVSWKGLSYSPANNGKNILHTDLWPGDLLDLIRDMDTHL